MKVPIRVVPFEGEMLVGYLWRVGRENCISSMPRLRQALIGHAGRPMFADIGGFAERCRILPEEALRLGGFWKADDKGKLHSKAGNYVLPERFFVGRSYTPFCAQCVKEEGFYRSMWTCSLLSTCYKHQRRLHYICTDCRFPIKSETSRVRIQCQCGSFYGQQSVASQGEIALATLIEGCSPSNVPKELAIGLGYLLQEPVLRMLQTLWFLGDVFRRRMRSGGNEGRGSGSMKIGTQHIASERIIFLLSNWPTIFISEFQATLQKAARTNKPSESRRLWNAFRLCMSDDLNDCSPFLKSGFEAAFKSGFETSLRRSPNLEIQTDLMLS